MKTIRLILLIIIFPLLGISQHINTKDHEFDNTKKNDPAVNQVKEDQETTDKTELKSIIPNCTISISQNGINPICEGDSIALSASIQGGVYQWSRNGLPIIGATKSVYHAKIKGIYNILYYEPSIGCKGTASIDIKVNPSPNVEIQGLNRFYNINDPQDTIIIKPFGGILSGDINILNGNILNPKLIISGNYLLFYKFTDNNGCSGIDSRLISIK